MTLIALRRFGSNRVHRADVPAALIRAADVFGAPCELVDGPIAALCGATLRGALIRIPEGEPLDSWRRNGSLCRPCER